MKKIAFFTLIAFLLFTSCSTGDDVLNIDDNLRSVEVDSEPKIIVFGMYYPRCETNLCVEVYQFNGKTLLEDVTNDKPSSNEFFKGIFKHQVTLPNIRLDLLRLYNELPLPTLNSITGHTIGFPGSHDQPIYYLEYNEDGNRQFWTIDSDLDNLPKELHSYVRLLGGLIDIVHQADTTF
ncbi:hypothetical protein [Pseudofulvibacter geojedonensis]|uniref:Lipoprotein n=1 Tax=Pseudofulvibacter geojedonensis TaxID=1123758 RepID=A0ABW3I3V6_9FLAO